MTVELAIIGAGNMAEAIARGVLSAGWFGPQSLVAADVSPDRRDLFSRELGVRAVADNADAARGAKRLLLSVKPQQMAAVLAGLGPVVDPSALVVSIAAGISTAFIERNLGQGRRWRVIRTMPNTPMLVGEGMVAIAPGANATPEDMADARKLFESAASVIEVTEDKIDA